MKLNLLLYTAAVAVAICSCSGKNEWTVKGSVDQGAGRTMLLEASSNGRWYTIDTITIAKDNSFTVSQPAAGYPDIYRLTMDGSSLYFPVDSIETVTVTANAAAFDKDYTITGSTDADQMMSVDGTIARHLSADGTLTARNDSLLKRSLAEIMLAKPSGIVSYYIINKHVNGQPLFSAARRNDLRIIGAVANAFSTERPADPRTAYLKNLFLGNRITTPTDTILASEIGYPEIELYDNAGKVCKLSDAVAQHPVVILNFTNYAAEFSPALNVELNKIHEQYGQRVGIYQVAFDADEYSWRQAARNLPWTTVYNSVTDGTQYLKSYNVGAIPTSFILSGNSLRERVTDHSKLRSTVSKYL